MHNISFENRRKFIQSQPGVQKEAKKRKVLTSIGSGEVSTSGDGFEEPRNGLPEPIGVLKIKALEDKVARLTLQVRLGQETVHFAIND